MPIAISVVMALSALLVASDDVAGGKVLTYIALTCGVVWIVDLVCLVVVLALNSLNGER